MSELLNEESVFDDSSDLEESWAGENVTFDEHSPTSRKHDISLLRTYNDKNLIKYEFVSCLQHFFVSFNRELCRYK